MLAPGSLIHTAGCISSTEVPNEISVGKTHVADAGHCEGIGAAGNPSTLGHIEDEEKRAPP